MTNGTNKGQFKVGNLGRKKGSKNKTPNIQVMNQLLNMITDDLTTNYDKLTMNQKIRLLHAFSRKFETDVVIVEDMTFKFTD
jgi:hypothetical protein